MVSYEELMELSYQKGSEENCGRPIERREEQKEKKKNVIQSSETGTIWYKLYFFRRKNVGRPGRIKPISRPEFGFRVGPLPPPIWHKCTKKKNIIYFIARLAILTDGVRVDLPARTADRGTQGKILGGGLGGLMGGGTRCRPVKSGFLIRGIASVVVAAEKCSDPIRRVYVYRPHDYKT